MSDTRSFRLARGTCTLCGKIKVTDAINCLRCVKKRNEKVQQRNWDRMVEHEDYLRGDLKLVNTNEAAVILGVTRYAIYKRVYRGTLHVVRHERFAWFDKSDLISKNGKE